tara:strand:- start:5157 stop:5918 length:762 start_codon:yes stop_codon:yes gene_type:complete
MKIASYNVNGIRAAVKKGFDHWLASSNIDIICLQEIKANNNQFDNSLFTKNGYNLYLNSADKAGYSGVAIFSKISPNHIELGCGINEIDVEGRIIRLDFDSFSVMSVYFPSGTNPLRQSYKMDFLSAFFNYIEIVKKTIPNLIISGDFNICHQSIDIHNPERNKNTSGFLPEERSWLSKFLNSGFVDSFRYINKTPNNYSWWTYRANARSRNLGWRIDYNMISKKLLPKLKNASILSDVKHSDHCPVLLEIEK